MEVIQIQNWKHVNDIVESTAQHEMGIGISHIQFRGQADSIWKLDSGLKRIVQGGEISEEKARFYEVQVQREYAAQYHLIDEKLAYRPEMHRQAMFIDMQHFSCPTRVLDWTTSPYVGLYFAIGENFEKDGALFVWNSGRYNAYMKHRYPSILEISPVDVPAFEDYDFVQLLLPEVNNERIVRQQGTFSISNKILASHCDLINVPLKWSKIPALQKYIIPSTLKFEFMARLRLMNISASSLFPGMDGLGKSIKESLLIRKWTRK